MITANQKWNLANKSIKTSNTAKDQRDIRRRKDSRPTAAFRSALQERDLHKLIKKSNSNCETKFFRKIIVAKISPECECSRRPSDVSKLLQNKQHPTATYSLHAQIQCEMEKKKQH